MFYIYLELICILFAFIHITLHKLLLNPSILTSSGNATKSIMVSSSASNRTIIQPNDVLCFAHLQLLIFNYVPLDIMCSEILPKTINCPIHADQPLEGRTTP